MNKNIINFINQLQKDIDNNKIKTIEKLVNKIFKLLPKFNLKLKIDEVYEFAEKFAEKNNLKLIEIKSSVINYVIKELKKLGYSEGDIVSDDDLANILAYAPDKIVSFDFDDELKTRELIKNLIKLNYNITKVELIEGEGPGNYYIIDKSNLAIKNAKIIAKTILSDGYDKDIRISKFYFNQIINERAYVKELLDLDYIKNNYQDVVKAFENIWGKKLS